MKIHVLNFSLGGLGGIHSPQEKKESYTKTPPNNHISIENLWCCLLYQLLFPRKDVR